MPSRRAAQLIGHLLARQQQAPILEKKTRLPYGWAIWLRTLGPLPRPGHASEIIQVLLPRPLPGRPGRVPAPGMLRALRQLFWQGWDRPPRDQRWMRWVSAAISVLLHLLFFFALLWIALISMPPSPAAGGGGNRIQVELLGQGGAASGVGDPAAAAPSVEVPRTMPAAGASSSPGGAPATRNPPVADAPAAEAVAVPVAESVSAPAPMPPAPLPVAELPPPLPAPPLQATAVVEPTHAFVVPPPSVTRMEVVPRAPALPQVRERTVEVPPERPLQAPALASVPLQVPTPMVRQPQLQVRERPVATPLPRVVAAPARVDPAEVEVVLPQREIQVRERVVQQVEAVARPPALPVADVVAPEPRPTPLPSVRERRVADAPVPTPASTVAPTDGPHSAVPARPASSATRPVAPAPAAAPTARAAPDPGNWAAQAVGDDWSTPAQGRTATAGTGAQGLFDADGRIRVQDPAAGEGTAERGAPGGANDGWSRERIAQSGTWLKRPPYDYTPTSFDKYWAPNESLLAEWVRRGIKAIEIPLPGTSTRISCVISVLQFGGGCGLTDPNMQDQPATARPPPDVPFKPELQEGNGSR